ncbi:Protein involved in Cu(II)/Cu(I) resistance(Secreted) [Cupriavidus necator]|uniref:Protein involved in Cu(II)/Cu(I) resistance(Secreted) n=1 Tax=Cupriavidus necator TaxID=106590 RepID=A0A1K0J9W4_CUPNE|nr:Protein involved in Cu(II)/Cu(I) resistance(Secreted) [Cupriavidus necator]
MRTLTKTALVALTVVTLGSVAGVANAGVNSPRDTFTDGAHAMGTRDPFTDGSHAMGTRDPFTDGSHAVGERDTFSDGA